MLLIKPYSSDFLKNKKKYYKGKHSKSIAKNTDDMIKWIVSVLKSHIPVLPHGFRYDARALHLNSKMLDELIFHVEPMAWLNYSPTTDNSLNDNELGIDLNAILTKDN